MLLGLGTLAVVSCGGDADGGPTLPIAVASVAVSPAQATIEVGSTQQFGATARSVAGSVLSGRAVSWSSSSSALATVSGNGLATGIAAGMVTITATSGGVTGSAELVVEEPDNGNGGARDAIAEGMTMTMNLNQLGTFSTFAGGFSFQIFGDRIGECGPPPDCTKSGGFWATKETLLLSEDEGDKDYVKYAFQGSTLIVLDPDAPLTFTFVRR